MARVPIDELELDLDINSSEGVSLDHMCRMRMSFLLDQNKTMSVQTKFADAKAGALLAFIGLVATRGPAGIEGVDLASLIVAALHGAVLISCLIVLYPRYLSREDREAIHDIDRYSWPALASESGRPGEFSVFARTAEFSQLAHAMAHSNHALAHILLSKFAWLRAAFVLAVVDVCAQGAIHLWRGLG